MPLFLSSGVIYFSVECVVAKKTDGDIREKRKERDWWGRLRKKQKTQKCKIMEQMGKKVKKGKLLAIKMRKNTKK